MTFDRFVNKVTDILKMKSSAKCLCLGMACVICVCYWNSQWRGGFAWDGSALQFNWHPVQLVTGLVVLYGAVLYCVPLTWGENELCCTEWPSPGARTSCPGSFCMLGCC